MGDLLLAPIVNATVSKVIHVVSKQLSSAVGWKGDLQRFSDTLEMLQNMLQDADKRNVISSCSDLKPWLMKLRAIVDEADDMLEEVTYENLKLQLAYPKWKKVRCFFTSSNPMLFRLRIGKKVKNLNSRLVGINACAAQLGLQYRLAGTSVDPIAYPRQTNSFLPAQIVGRVKDVSKIESLLINDLTHHQGLPVVVIVGMPGLGKTTLAKAVCKTNNVCEKFGENVLWVSVSNNFEPMWILKKMLECVSKSDGMNVSSEEVVMRKIQDVLRKKNYLLILDDVWNEERHKWEMLRNCLLGLSQSKGNRVLVTTRSKDVASIMASTEEYIHFPEGLQDRECWTIIQQRAFGSSSVPQELEEVGVEISRKCQGIPLVASLIGATLQLKRDRREWCSILNNEVWHSLGRESGILDIIKISYDRLPELALKQCFAFCSVFPKAFVMEKEMLIQLWMAMGFLQSSEKCSVEMEDVGDKYFRCLLSHSLLQEEGRRLLGRVTSCKMHDLIHDFAESISNSETMIFKEDSGNIIPSHVRHLNFIYDGGLMPTSLRDVAMKLQTLISQHSIPKSVQKGLKRLRILSLCAASDVKHLEACLGNSKSLRYLDISGTKMEEFPKFIKSLFNLQTLRFMNCKNLRMPPEGLCNLINLRHIYFNDEKHMPANLGRLTNLQTLQLFLVSTMEGCRIEELGSLRKLKGRLEIHKLELVKSRSEAKKAKLHEKMMDALLYSWSVGRESDGDYDEGVLEGLQPHSNLQRLYIEGFGGVSLKSVSGFHLNNLVHLHIMSCPKLKTFPVMEGFSSLQSLHIGSCNELTDGVFVFPALQKLPISDCPKLETFTNNGLPSLEELFLYKCGVLFTIGNSLSACPCLQVLSVNECRNLEFLPSLHGLSSLQYLRIFVNDKFVFLPSGLSSCTALKVLTLTDCKNLVSIRKELKELHALVELQILCCPKLSSLSKESLNCLVRLKKLKIGPFSHELEEFPGLDSISKLPASLEKLELRGWKNLTQLPCQVQFLTSLKRLCIKDFDGVEALPEWLGNLSSLVELSIYGCRRIRSFPEESFSRLTCLEKLGMGPFAEDLEEVIGQRSIHHLHVSLKELTLCGWEKLTQLPHQIQHLTALEDLWLHEFSGLEALPDWLGDMPSLQYLYISGSKNLKHLPSAKVILRLSKLKDLTIYPDWPELKKKIKQVKESTSQS